MAQKTAAERIREYKELLDEGMITKEEFELKKKKILETEDAEFDAEAKNAAREDNVFSGHYFSDKDKGTSGGSSISTKSIYASSTITTLSGLWATISSTSSRPIKAPVGALGLGKMIPPFSS